MAYFLFGEFKDEEYQISTPVHHYKELDALIKNFIKDYPTVQHIHICTTTEIICRHVKDTPYSLPDDDEFMIDKDEDKKHARH